MKKILAIDIGNSNIVVGLFVGKRLKWHRRFETNKTLSCLRKLSLKDADGVVVASVVPKIDSPLRMLLKKKFGVEPIFVTSRIPLPIQLKVKKPLQVGADRIANAVAAFCWERVLSGGSAHRCSPVARRRAPDPQPPAPLIIIDFGTATTFDVVSEDGEYLGGPIIPGLGICAEALHEKTAKLPLVPIKRPARVIGKETHECIQSGLYYGYAGMVDRLVEKIQKEYGKKMRVTATGGLASLAAPECKTIKVNYPFLTLKGLQLIYKYHEGTA